MVWFGDRPGLCALLAGLLVLSSAGCASVAPGPSTTHPSGGSPGDFDRVTAGFQAQSGLLEVFSDPRSARVLVGLHPDQEGQCGEFLYRSAMRSGLGLADIGIDRASPGDTQLLKLHRVGKKIFAEFENTSFTADQGSSAERRAVRESFPPSIVWSGEVLAERADGLLVVDFTDFLVRDAAGVSSRLKETKQGDFRLDAARSYADVTSIHVLPDNLEFDAVETFASDTSGDEVKRLLPDAHALTLTEHHSLIRLPGPGFETRLADPRTGSFDTLVADYSAPLSEPIVRRLADRFRLEKIDPQAARSRVRKPIVFYVDNAAPEPVRTALLEGARWWTAAFEDAGYIDAFHVEILPADVDPLDVRYNVIHWVHRQTRGWSYGGALADPRTGEIVNGYVLLGSLRLRQDQLIFQGLVGADRTGSGAADDPTVVSLARLRQLAVHEVGHALGLEHNFAGSSFDDRASVMDYPFPRIGIHDGELDFSDAYKVGIGSWDRFAIRWLYGSVPEGAEGQAALRDLVREAYADGLRFVGDQDARPSGSAHPHGALWDDGNDPVANLEHVLKVRALALQRFGPANLPPGTPLSDLRRAIVPIYLFHRYAVAAVAKSVGGVEFNYAVRGDALPPALPVDPKTQRRALAALLATLSPKRLDLPDTLVNQLSQGRDGSSDRQYEMELFGDPAATVFSRDAAAAAAVDITLTELLNPDRLARVDDQHQRDPAQLGVAAVLSQLVDAVFPAQTPPGRLAQLQRVAARRTVVHLAGLLTNHRLTPAVGNAVQVTLEALVARLHKLQNGSPEDLAQAHFLAEAILNRNSDRLNALADEAKAFYAVSPPGMPIGAGALNSEDMCWFCEAEPGSMQASGIPRAAQSAK